MLLSLAVLSIILMTAFVFATIAGVSFTAPVPGANISGSYNVQWTNTNGYVLYLQSGAGNCSPTTWNNLTAAFVDPNATSFVWDTSSLNGVYCLRLLTGLQDETSGIFTIDNTAPIANLSAGAPYSCNEGGWVILNASASTDVNTGIADYEWNNGSGYVSGGVTYNYTCGNGPSTPTISLKVTDFAGKTNTTSTTVNISNVVPVCYGITSIANSAVGTQVNFSANATDVVDTLTYAWNFNDSNTGIGNPGTHAYSSNGTYTVSVTVSDGTATCQNTTTIIIHEITTLLTQEAVALQNLTTNFGTKNGTSLNSFSSGLTGTINCTELTSTPATITNSSTDCVVTWNNINNSDYGSHLVNVQIYNGSDYKYYSFNITVYSWAIDLVEGWNMISIPLLPDDTVINTVLDNVRNNIEYDSSAYSIYSYQYDGSANKWYKAKPNSGKTSITTGDLDYVVPGYAYWIKMSSADTLYGFGDKTSDQGQTPPSVTVTNGWNLIGHYGLKTVTNAEALTSLVLGNTTYYDYVGTDGSFYPEEGYWITAKFLPNEQAPYTPSTASYNFY